MHRLIKWLILITVLLVFRLSASGGDRVRPPHAAGQFYPDDSRVLSTMLGGFLNKAKADGPDGLITGLWVPHAGYVFSGQIAANGYRLLKGSAVDLAVILGPSHYVRLRGASIGDYTAYRTPLGDAIVDTAVAQILWDNRLFRCEPEAHIYEHSLEVQIPFLQTVLPQVKILPVLIGEISYSDCKRIADALVKAVGQKRVVFIASSDMSRFEY